MLLRQLRSLESSRNWDNARFALTDGGSIVFGGAGEFANIPDGGEQFAIQGGTGAYSDVTGQVTITPDLGTRLLFEFGE